MQINSDYKTKYTPWIGTLALGQHSWTGVSKRNCELVISAALEHGFNRFDTALAYGNGCAEKHLGRLLKPRRTKIYIASKMLPTAHSYQQVIAACDRSLTNLQTDYIDCYQIHWPSAYFNPPQPPLEESLSALDDLQQAGKIRHIGVCNVSLEELKRACKFTKINSVQCCYSLFWRHATSTIIPYCQQQGIQFLAYSPLAQGLLTDNFQAHRLHRSDMRFKNRLFDAALIPAIRQATLQLSQIAARYHITLSRLAIHWLQQQSLYPIVGASRAEHIQALAAADNNPYLHISTTDLQKIDTICHAITKPMKDYKTPWEKHKKPKH